MRISVGVTLCFMLGACATFGGGEPGPYGIWDIVSINGQTLPAAGLTEGWCELSGGGTEMCALTIEGLPNPIPDRSPFTLGAKKDGCYPYESTHDEGTVWTGSICGDVFTVESSDLLVILHKRR